MKIRKLTIDQRGRIAEKMMEWGNLVFIAWVVSQVISGTSFKTEAAIAGVICLLGAYWIGIKIMKGGGKKWL